MLPGIGQFDRAADPLEQLLAQMVFQRCDLPADRTLGHAKFLCGARETQQPRRAFEGAGGIQRGAEGAVERVHSHP